MSLSKFTQKFIDGASLAGDFISEPLNLTQNSFATIQLNYTGDAVGNLAIQGTIDPDNEESWADLPLVKQGATVVTEMAIPSCASPLVIDMKTTTLQFVRVKFDHTSGSGSLDGLLNLLRGE